MTTNVKLRKPRPRDYSTATKNLKTVRRLALRVIPGNSDIRPEMYEALNSLDLFLKNLDGRRLYKDPLAGGKPAKKTRKPGKSL